MSRFDKKSAGKIAGKKVAPAKKSAKKAKTKTKARTKSEVKVLQISTVWALVFVSLAVSIVASGLGVIETAAETRALYKMLGEVQREHDQLLEEHSRLSLERSTMSSLQKIETVAVEQLEMEFPTRIGRLEND